MHGNVEEWCGNKIDYYPLSIATGASSCLYNSWMAIRGGCYDLNANICRSGFRKKGKPDYYAKNTGFRLLRMVE